MQYYESINVLETRNITLAGNQPNDDPVLQNKFIYQGGETPHKWANERVPLNDCLLRNVQKYQYIACIDIDEVIVPENESTWSDMMKRLEKQKDKVLQIMSKYSHTRIAFIESFSWFMGIQNDIFSG